MLEILGLFAGIALGVGLNLVPGLHPAMVLALLVGFPLSGNFLIMVVVGAAGSGLYTRHLSTVYNASAVEAAASDAALAMTAKGEGRTALATMVYATDLTLLLVSVLSIGAFFCFAATVPVAKGLHTVLDPIGVIAILAWVWNCCSNAARP